jgi:glucose-6-phosphate isomerase, archaeal
MNASPLFSVVPEDLFVSFSLDSARLGERPMVERHLSDLKGCFADPAAYDAALEKGDPLLYAVTAVEPASGEGQLHYGLGVLYPGKVGAEYYLTKGHYHSFRPAAEVYVGLEGEGGMLLEDEATGESRFVPLRRYCVVYVPGHTAHRTVNTGNVPLVYLGIFPSNAGHDYGAIARKNFRQIVVDRNGTPAVLDRSARAME